MADRGWKSDDFVAAWSALLRMHAFLVPIIEGELVNETGMPLGWYDVLLELSAAPGHRLRMVELGEVAVLSRTRVSRVVDELQSAGYVTRVPNPDDGRSAFAQLTPEGKAAFLASAPAYLTSIRTHLGAALSAKEATTLRSLLEKVLAQADSPTPSR